MADAPRKIIKGRTFIFGTLPASTALKVELAIAPVLAEALAAFGAGSLEKLSEEAGSLLTARAAGEVLKRLAAEDYTSPDGARHMGLQTLMETVFAHVTIVPSVGDVAAAGHTLRPRPANLDQDFTGKAADKYIVLVEALKENFADFFPAAPSSSSPVEVQQA